MSRIGKLLFIAVCEAVKRTMAPLLVRIFSGVNRGIRWSPLAGDNDYALGTYETDTGAVLLEQIRPGFICYDVGANKGFFTLAMSRMTGSKGKVYSFEPHLPNLEFVRRHLLANRMENVQVFDCPVADSVKEVAFTLEFFDAANTFIRSAHWKVDEKVRRVLARSLDSLVASEEILAADVVKIDVEGAELEVLNGMSSLVEQSMPVIILATHEIFVSGIKEKCLGWLVARGYKVQALKMFRESALEDFVATPVEGKRHKTSPHAGAAGN